MFLKPTLLITTVATVVAVSSLALIALSATAALGQDDPRQELAERYAPVSTLKAQEAECDSNGEQYAPMAADIVLDNPQILLRQVGNGDPVVAVGPSAADLHSLGEGFYLDFPGDALDPGCLYEKDFRRYTEGRPAAVYAHVATQDDAPGQLALQYWFFYYYNNYTNLHEGDWEGIQLLFNAGTVADALTVDPVSIGYSQHFGGERADWTSDKLERRGTHPVVYPAVGSHASYFNSSLYLGRSASEGLGCDNTEGPSVALEPDVIVLPDTIDDRNDPLAWLAFEGLWGERRSGPFSGPTGPATKERWTTPIDWHNTLRSASVAVPGGADTDTPIVGTFCNVVGWGSAQYIALQQNPARILAIGAAILAVAFIALRRTGWTPVNALPIARRRQVGQIIPAAARLYRRQPRRFIEIGLVHLPVAVLVGIVVAIVQVTLQAITPVDSDGNLGPIGLFISGTVSTLGLALATVIVTATAFVLITNLATGTPVSGGQAYRDALGRLRDLAAGLARAVVIVGGLSVTIVGIPWAIRQLVRYQFLAQVTMDEGLRGKAALDRSTELVKGRWVHTAAVAAIVNGLVSLVNGAVGLTLLLAAASLPLWAFSILVGLASAIVAPFAATNMVLLYGDAKAEKEQLAPAQPLEPAPA